MFGVGLLGAGNGSGPSGPVYDPAAAAFFARLTNQPTPARAALYNALFVSLRANGILSLLDALYIMAAADSQAAGQNLIQNAYSLTPVNSPVFTVDRGYAGDGASAYLTTGIAPGAGGLQYQRNTAHFSVYDRTTRAGADVYQIGSFDSGAGSFSGILTRSSSNTTGIGVNDDGTFAGIANASNPGFYAGDRASSTAFGLYKNGASAGTASTTTVATGGTVGFSLLALNVSGSLSGFTTDQLAAASIGASLGATKQGQLYTAIQAYMTGVGANV